MIPVGPFFPSVAQQLDAYLPYRRYMVQETLRMVEGGAKHFDVDVDMGEFVAKKTPAHIPIDFGRSSDLGLCLLRCLWGFKFGSAQIVPETAHTT